ncbi:MAG: hypothetical protein ISS65_10710 [Desulfobacterales bacterium]|uniref:DNA binding HTH domain-containing protein n=1 Tax=Candidatus Desulfatibia profunda TaxID=2841695 RepID=A0A8J6NTW8_9BACT|nr:hypothetical protein [Candidatus Desulfatibia profunda]MBL7180661.1 hypothetical protein [Desulfobacterales bacterium]
MEKALENTNWNRKKAAMLLKISYKSLLNKMARQQNKNIQPDVIV